MKPTPANWPRFTSAVVYSDGAAAIHWLCQAFGFDVRLRVEDENGKLQHCELVFGDGAIMIAQASEDAVGWRSRLRSPLQTGGKVTQSLMIYVDDADAHCERARRHGATIVQEPTTQDYGAEHWSDRSYGAIDPEGHVWWIAQRVR